MQLQTLKSLRNHLTVLVMAGEGNPIALRLNLRRVTLLLVSLSLVLLFAVVGSLLFFREMELNRKLSERVLELETMENLRQLIADTPISYPKPEGPTPRAVPAVKAPAPVAPVASAVPVAPPASEAASLAAVEAPVVAPPRVTPSRARLSDVQVECDLGVCDAKVSLMRSSTGPAEGSLVLVLETEVPRIGTGTAGSGALRKRFFIYPGGATRDEIGQEAVGKMEGKPFKFTRALQTTATFQVGELYRPLALNVYIYDASKSLVQHERKPIDPGE